MKDKVVVITGSSRGIGKSIALEFLKAGAKVVINGRSPDTVKSTSEEFENTGYQVFPCSCDVSLIDDCKNLVSKTIGKFGRLDILINNAGGGFRGLFEETAPEIFRQVIDSNLMSAAYMTRAAIEEIKKTNGSIVFISSVAGIRGLPQNSPYCVAKMGLIALAQSLRIELMGSNVHVGIAMIGLTDFDENKRITNADGSLVSISRKSHHTRQQVAKIVFRMVEKRKFYKVLTPLGKLTSIFQRISPAFIEWMILRSSKTVDYNQ